MTSGEQAFGGQIGRTYRESTPWWPEPVRAPDGAPNIVFVVLDDVGFAHLGCYGSDIATPNMDRLAARRPALHRISTPPRCARRRALRCSPGATTTRPASGPSPSSPSGSRATRGR